MLNKAKEESNTKIYCFDIDETICNTPSGNYFSSVPIKERIKKINKLYDEGNEIIYHTARGSKTKINWSELTERQLNDWGCKYHHLTTKPYADYYIDDKAVNANKFFK